MSLDHVERRLTSVQNELRGLGMEVRSLRDEVQHLRVVCEQNAAGLKRIAEVQAQHGNTLADHGRKLDEIIKALEPLARLDAFVRRDAPLKRRPTIGPLQVRHR